MQNFFNTFSRTTRNIGLSEVPNNRNQNRVMTKLWKNLAGVRPHHTDAIWFGNAYILMDFGLMSIKLR